MRRRAKGSKIIREILAIICGLPVSISARGQIASISCARVTDPTFPEFCKERGKDSSGCVERATVIFLGVATWRDSFVQIIFNYRCFTSDSVTQW